MIFLLLLETLFLLALIGLSAFFSGSETALFSLSQVTVEKLRHRHPTRGEIISKLLGKPRRLLVSIVVGNMLVNILSSTVAERLAAGLFPAYQALAWLFSTVLVALLILILGEVVPKTLALNRAAHYSLKVAPSILLFDQIVLPVRRAIRFVSDRIVHLLWRNRDVAEAPLTKDELATAIEVGSREGTLDGEEREMINEIFELGDKTVRQLMTPRNEVVSFELRTPLKTIASVIRAKEYSRVPVYSEKEDEIIGILYPKDLVVALARGERIGHLGAYLRSPLFVPETMKASRLLTQFLQRKVHIALAVDEYGALAGLITLDDLVEEIVGEMRDKGEIATDVVVVSDDVVRLRGRTELSFVNEELGLDLFSGESVTLGGFLFEKLGRIPQPGEIWDGDGVCLEVLSMKGNRVDQVLIQHRGIGRRAEKESV